MRSDPGILHALEGPNHETLVLSYSGCTPGSDFPKDLLLSKIHHCLRKYCLFSCACATHLSSTYFPALHRFLGSYCLSELLHGGRSVTAEAIPLFSQATRRKARLKARRHHTRIRILSFHYLEGPKHTSPSQTPKLGPTLPLNTPRHPPNQEREKQCPRKPPSPSPQSSPLISTSPSPSIASIKGVLTDFKNVDRQSRREKRKGSREV